ncbi:MAG TPA: HAMP domain-containing sensor histidine kinase [archaeon]|nr:HAMP domain-containing sensor histidine kinase [archaeon]
MNEKDNPEYWTKRAKKKKEDFDSYVTEKNFDLYKLKAMNAVRDVLGEADNIFQSGLAVSAEMNAYFPDSFRNIYLLDEIEEEKFISCLDEEITIEGDAAEKIKKSETIEKDAESGMDIIVPVIGKEGIKKEIGYPKNEKTVIGAIELGIPKNPKHESYSELLFFHQKLAGRIGYEFHEDFLMKHAKEMDYHLKNLIEMISHDTKNDLVSIGGFSNRLFNKTEGENKKYAEAIVKNVNHMEKLFDHIARIEPSLLGKKILEKEKIDIIPLLDNLIQIYGKKFNKVDREFNTEKAEIMGSSFLIQSIYKNLITNGRKYGDGYLRIGVIDKDSVLDTYVLNNGKGIPEKYRKDIFERRFRIKGLDEDGLGIGLSIVKKNVNIHKGRVYIDSGKDYVVFHIEFPKAY